MQALSEQSIEIRQDWQAIPRAATELRLAACCQLKFKCVLGELQTQIGVVGPKVPSLPFEFGACGRGTS